MRAEDILPGNTDFVDKDGLRLRKGSVAAFIANAQALAQPDTPAAERAQAEADLLALVPALRALGVFEVFALRQPAVRALVENSAGAA